MREDLFAKVYACLQSCDADTKVRQTAALRAAWEEGGLSAADTLPPAEPVPGPGRPEKPRLVPPQQVETRKVSTIEGRAALIHSLAHIEFNAINLALDAVYRFRELPDDYYADWLRVAAEEACHFTLLRDHLRKLGYDYGHFTAHDGLWQMALRTGHDPLVRMALVPRVLEARGLDVTPAIMHKLASSGDREAVKILEIIQQDEIGHVAIGNRWYLYLCSLRGLEPLATFRQLLHEYDAPKFGGFLHREARREAGFTDAEMKLLEDFASLPKA